jgi:LmbE family N-acetylglucosaminyl deacetylase
MHDDLTLMAVHAHPDDEVIGTGGLLARCADEGIRTVLVTCTNGEQGDGPDGVKPDHAAHDQAQVSLRRLEELRDSVEILGIAHLELLGYRDSGMAGWSANSDPGTFTNVPVEEAAGRLAALMARYRPQVVVTYDETGGYGHPDHIQAHRITLAAAQKSAATRKLYFSVIPRARVRELIARLREAGLPGPELPADFGTPDEQITTVVDVSRYAERKRKALEAHASQGDNIFLLRLPEDLRERAFSQESFVRHFSRVAAPEREDDLFAGLR